MKTIITSLIFSLWCIISTAQTTAIPDPAFEKELISHGIDTDGVINGQVFSADLHNVTELIIDPDHNAGNIYSLTGIEDFINLEKLTVIYSMITQLNVSQNIKLKELTCGNNYISELDVSSNTLLEVLDIGNYAVDLGFHTYISEINLSSNPNIRKLYATHSPNLKIINLKNGSNNPDMYINLDFDVWDSNLPDPLNTVCIQVDNENLAQNNQFPYSEWDIYDLLADYNFSKNCALSTSKFQKTNTVSLYPNPATNIINIASNEPVTEAAIYNLLSQKVKQLPAGSTTLTADVNRLTTGTYFIMVKTDKGNSTEKLVIK